MVNDTAIGKFLSSFYIPIIPLPDGNGRVGRLILFKECLRYNFTPIVIEDRFKQFYYRGLAEYKKEKGYLTDTCLNGQDMYRKIMEYYHIVNGGKNEEKEK